MYDQKVAFEYFSDLLDASVSGISFWLPAVLQVVPILEHGLQMFLDVEYRELAHEEYKFGDFTGQ